jgi:hypothetical protein
MNWTEETNDDEVRSLSKRVSQLCANTVGWQGDMYSDGTSTYAN